MCKAEEFQQSTSYLVPNPQKNQGSKINCQQLQQQKPKNFNSIYKESLKSSQRFRTTQQKQIQNQTKTTSGNFTKAPENAAIKKNISKKTTIFSNKNIQSQSYQHLFTTKSSFKTGSPNNMNKLQKPKVTTSQNNSYNTLETPQNSQKKTINLKKQSDNKVIMNPKTSQDREPLPTKFNQSQKFQKQIIQQTKFNLNNLQGSYVQKQARLNTVQKLPVTKQSLNQFTAQIKDNRTVQFPIRPPLKSSSKINLLPTKKPFLSKNNIISEQQNRSFNEIMQNNSIGSQNLRQNNKSYNPHYLNKDSENRLSQKKLNQLTNKVESLGSQKQLKLENNQVTIKQIYKKTNRINHVVEEKNSSLTTNINQIIAKQEIQARIEKRKLSLNQRFQLNSQSTLFPSNNHSKTNVPFPNSISCNGSTADSLASRHTFLNSRATTASPEKPVVCPTLSIISPTTPSFLVALEKFPIQADILDNQRNTTVRQLNTENSLPHKTELANNNKQNSIVSENFNSSKLNSTTFSQENKNLLIDQILQDKSKEISFFQSKCQRSQNQNNKLDYRSTPSFPDTHLNQFVHYGSVSGDVFTDSPSTHATTTSPEIPVACTTQSMQPPATSSFPKHLGEFHKQGDILDNKRNVTVRLQQNTDNYQSRKPEFANPNKQNLIITENKLNQSKLNSTRCSQANENQQIDQIEEETSKVSPDTYLTLKVREDFPKKTDLIDSQIRERAMRYEKTENSQQRKIGFTNSQQSCYIQDRYEFQKNSVLQCLINSEGFFDFFAGSKQKKKLPIEFEKICKYFNKEQPDKKPYNADNLKMELCKRDKTFVGSNQQDAQEFLRSFLDGLHEDLNKIKEPIPYEPFEAPLNIAIPTLVRKWREYSNALDQSIVFDSFEGNILNSIKCNSCKLKTLTCQNFLDLSLPIAEEARNSFQNSLDSILRSFFKQTEKVNSFTCEYCQNQGFAEQEVKLSHLPQFLVLHIKRFCVNYDLRGNQILSKINTKIQFPTIQKLDMKPYLTPNMKIENEDYSYQLYGIVHHQGSIHQGHYTATCKNPIDKTWNRFDDSNCQPIDDKELNAYEAQGSSSPYILFYERRTQL